jgi:hypothetical protein
MLGIMLRGRVCLSIRRMVFLCQEHSNRIEERRVFGSRNEWASLKVVPLGLDERSTGMTHDNVQDSI